MGSSPVDSMQLIGTSATFTLPVLPPGVHHLHAIYDGNENFEGSRSEYVRYNVVPAEGFVLDVTTGVFSGVPAIRAFGHSPYPYGTRFVIQRRVNGGPWTIVSANSPTPESIHSGPAAGMVYSYKMDAYDASNQFLGASNVDSAMLFPFIDPPLLPGLRIKAAHVQQRRRHGFSCAGPAFPGAARLAAMTRRQDRWLSWRFL